MKTLARAALLVAVLAALALGALALILPRMVDGEAARARIEGAVQDALGRQLRYERLEVGLLPPSLVLVAPALSGATPDAPDFAEARRLSLRVALLPLLARRVLVDRVVAEGATLRLRRGADGFELPAPPARADAGAGASGAGAEGGAAPVAVRRVDLRDATLRLEDASRSPPVLWELGSLDAKLRGRSPAEPLRVEASFTLAGGRVEGRGTVSLAGELDVELSLDEVGLAPAASYLDADARLAGTVSGTLALAGPARRPHRVTARLSLKDGDVALDEIALRGPLRVEADLEGEPGAPSGRFDVDASDAELVVGGAFRKPPGTAATVTGRLVSGPDGLLGVDDVKLHVRNVDAAGKLRTGRRTQLELSAAPFELAGWEELVPALSGWKLRGPLELDGISFASSPPEVRGRLGLSGVEATAPGGGALLLRGALVGDGARAKGEGLELVAAGQPVELAAELVALEAPRLSLRFAAREADVDRLLAELAGKRGALHGRLTLDGELALPFGADPLQALAGRLRFEVADARMGGKSLIDVSLDALAAISRPVDRLASELLSGGRRAGDRIDSIAGSFVIGGGHAQTSDLRIVERDRRIDLRGSVRLADLALDLRGTLSLGSSGKLPLRVPIAHVGGSLGNPHVEVTPEAARGLTAALSPGRLGRGLERALDGETARGLAGELGELLDRSRR